MDKPDQTHSLQEARSPMKVAPPAPIRRASSRRPTALQMPTISTSTGIAEDQEDRASVLAAGRQDNFDEADRNELDELERQHETVRASSELQKTVAMRLMRIRTSSNAAASSSATAREPVTVSSLLGAPQINGASTPRPFGDDLPTPNIISRDLTRPMREAETTDGHTTKTSSSAVASTSVPSTAHELQQQQSSTKQKRRPSSTGPILCALGCGEMGRSIFSGVLDALEDSDALETTSATLRPPARFIACVRSQGSAERCTAELGNLVSVVRGADANAQAVRDSDYILLCCKPQMAKDILTAPGMQDSLRGKVVISILAGKTIESLQVLCPESKIIRVMPNTPSRIRKGMSVIVSGPGVTDASLDLVSWIFNQVGKTLIMDEKHIDAATALCGSGPAFMAVILESMTDGGVMMGIPRAQAQELAAQTMLGTASLVQAGQHPALIRNAVATPGGCTIGGLLEMEDGKIRSTMSRTIQTATNIAAGLGK